MERIAPGARLVVLIAAAAAFLPSGCTGNDSDDPPPSSSGSQTTDETPPTTPEEVVHSQEHIDIGGRELFMSCWGQAVGGEPAILLVSGAELTIDSWLPMAEDFAAEGHHVCGYDRAGIGLSDAAPEHRRTLEDQVADLEALLDAADLREPVVVVAHSAGSLLVTGLVDQAPSRVAGVVLVDPQCPRVDIILSKLIPPEKPNETPELAEERRWLTEVRFDPTQNPEHLLLAATERAAVAILDKPGPLFGDIPVVVLQAPRIDLPGLPARYLAALDAALVDGKAEFAAESTRGTLVEVPNSSHFIQDDEPEVVIDAIRDVLAG